MNRIMYGDKDIFRFMFLLADVPFFFVPELIGYAVYQRYGLDSVVHSFNTYSVLFNHSVSIRNEKLAHNPSFREIVDERGRFHDSLPMFFHQVKVRNAETFSHYLRVAPDASGYLPPSYCFDSAYRDRSPVEMLPGSPALEAFAGKLFSHVDSVWRKHQAENTLYIYKIVDYMVLRIIIVEYALNSIGVWGIATILLIVFFLFRCCFFRKSHFLANIRRLFTYKNRVKL